MPSIFLIGPPASGKTVCGKALAQKLQCNFVDSDQAIEEQQQLTVSQIFATRGEGFFRKLEEKFLRSLEIRGASQSPIVYATGGGMPIYDDNMATMLHLGEVVWLDARLETLVSRLGADQKRPLLNTGMSVSTLEVDKSKDISERLSKLLSSRMEVYARARYKIDTSGLSPEQVADEIMRLLSLTPGR